MPVRNQQKYAFHGEWAWHRPNNAMPRPLSGCQIKAEIKGFLLVYRLFLYKHWFLPNFELKDFPEYTVTPCKQITGMFDNASNAFV